MSTVLLSIDWLMSSELNVGPADLLAAAECGEEFGDYSTVYADLDSDTVDEYIRLGASAQRGVYVELTLLVGIIVNTALLAGLLHQTKKQLSTATILFVFNILFSNVVFVSSFLCLFYELFTGERYGAAEESESLLDFIQHPRPMVAETLKLHLYSPAVFLKNLAQETLLSLAQNGSLLGLTHLLLLVLMVG